MVSQLSAMEALPLLSRWLHSNCEVVSCRVCVAIYGEEVHGGDGAIQGPSQHSRFGFSVGLRRRWRREGGEVDGGEIGRTREERLYAAFDGNNDNIY
ncbi:hypothetical protein LR48_Vigan10g180600 [Vigna angularis]|uniref:Uncharacterized protein n=1 Tax=Phaseolus angularis TaxID=3914 RepID=A0A0L9VME7_PHAAN|nr:hypothetical protein LR48_Vigan10g180600 [Vigna angularis]